MKLFISILITFNAQAMIVIEHDKSIVSAEKIFSILQERYSIPSSLIEIIEGKCRKSAQKKIAHLCIDTKGELYIKQFDLNVISNSLQVFAN